MPSPTRSCQPSDFFLCVLPIAVLTVLGCTKLVLDPNPVVPTRNPLPYTAHVELADAASYFVEPGATMIADPNIQNHVVGKEPGTIGVKTEWERAIRDYVAGRHTFAPALLQGAIPDLSVALRLMIYIDPGIEFKFNHIYIAKSEATVRDSRSGRVISTYSGFGKAAGEVSRGGKEDDEEAVNQAVHASLDELFGKLETDLQVRRL